MLILGCVCLPLRKSMTLNNSHYLIILQEWLRERQRWTKVGSNKTTVSKMMLPSGAKPHGYLQIASNKLVHLIFHAYVDWRKIRDLKSADDCQSAGIVQLQHYASNI